MSSQTSTHRAPSLRDETRIAFRTAVLRAAEEIFAERGFHGARIQDIAERARVGVGTVYNHFAQKEDLLVALLDQHKGEILETYARRDTDPTDFVGELYARQGRMLDYVARHRSFFVFSSDHGLFGNDVATATAIAGQRDGKHSSEYRARQQKLIQRGIDEGAIVGDAKELARFFGGAMRSVLEGALRDGAEDLRAHGDRVIELFIKAASPDGVAASHRRSNDLHSNVSPSVVAQPRRARKDKE